MVPRNSVHHLARPSLIVPYPIPGIYTTADRYLRTLTFYSSYEYLLLIRTWAVFFHQSYQVPGIFLHIDSTGFLVSFTFIVSFLLTSPY